MLSECVFLLACLSAQGTVQQVLDIWSDSVMRSISLPSASSFFHSLRIPRGTCPAACIDLFFSLLPLRTVVSWHTCCPVRSNRKQMAFSLPKGTDVNENDDFDSATQVYLEHSTRLPGN